MKRLIITLPESAYDADAAVWRLPDGQGWVGDLRDVDWLTVEDIPDPLPTTPGERFWGQSESSPPEWWFVTDQPVGNSLDYHSASGIAWDLRTAERSGLVRLPDPEAAP